MSKLIEVKKSNNEFEWINPDNIESIRLVKLGFGYEDVYIITFTSANYIEVSRDELKRLMERGFNYIQPHPKSPDDILEIKEN